MFSVLYVEIYNESSSSYNFLYYMLNYSSNYLTAVEGEKTYGEETGVTQDRIVFKIADLINSLGGGANSLVILTDNLYKSLVQDCLNEAEAYLYISRGMPFVVKSISEQVHLTGLSLYDLYISRFGEPSGMCKLDIVNQVVVDLVLAQDTSDSAFIFIKTVKRAGYTVLTVSWCTISYSYDVSVLGYLSNCFDLDSDNFAEFNKFIKSVKCEIANTGLSFDMLIPVFYSDNSARDFNDLSGRYGVKLFDRYITLTDSLRAVSKPNLWSKNTELKGHNVFMRLYSSVLRSEYLITAKELVNVFVDLAPKLELTISDDRTRFTSTHKYYKDFSSDIVAVDVKNNFKYAIVIDCEGTSYGGCKEVGGIIFAYGGQILAKLETFYFKQRDFVDGITGIVSRFEKITGRYLPVKGIPVITYGGSDKNMILGELQESASRGVRRRFKSQFEFIDIQGYVFSYLDKIGLTLENRKLSDVAETLGVETILPKHNALNDAKTLFNVLSRIYMFEDDFIID